jgi:hypothetical protein
MADRRDLAPAPPARRPATAAAAPPSPDLGGPGTARGPAQRDTESAAPESAAAGHPGYGPALAPRHRPVPLGRQIQAGHDRPAASVRPGTSTVPDTLATSPDAVRKSASEKTPGLRKGFVLALSRITLSCIRRWVTAPRAKFGARAERRPHPARAGPRRCVCLRTVRLDRGQHGVHHRSGHWQRGYRKPVASAARGVGLEAGAVAEVAEGAAEGVGEWLGGLVPG